MNTYKKSLLWILVLFVCFSVVNAAEQPESVQSKLNFKMSEESFAWYDSWNRYIPKVIKWKPVYVAVFRLEHVRNWREYDLINVSLRAISLSPRPMVLEHWKLKKERKGERKNFYLCLPKGKPKVPMDGREVDFDEDDEEFFEPGHIRNPEIVEQPEAKGLEIWVYAKSEEEARGNAKTVIDLIGQLSYAPMEYHRRNLRFHRELIEKFEIEIPELEKKYEEIKTEIEERQKTVHYRYKEDAKRSILHWMDILSAIEVDIVGIKARLSTIKEFIDSGKTTRSMLVEMQVVAEVDLAGALARKDAAQTFKQEAVDFIALSRESYILSQNIPAKQEELKQLKNKVPFIEKKLSNLVAANIQPVEVVGNEVTIHPVK